MLKSSSGLLNEKKQSLKFHQEGTALLVSSLCLRSRSMGQIDLARIKKNRSGYFIEIGEVKSSQVGVEGAIYGQKQRLWKGQMFLSAIFGFPSKLIHLVR